MEFFKPGRVFDFMGAEGLLDPAELHPRRRLGRSSASIPGPTTAPTSAAAPRSRSPSRSPSTRRGVAQGGRGSRLQRRRTSSRSSTRTTRTTSSSACRTSAPSTTRRRTRSRRALCFTEDAQAPVADAATCPPNARATEVKFSAGGDKISTRYDTDPDLEKIKAQIAQRPGHHLCARARRTRRS